MSLKLHCGCELAAGAGACVCQGCRGAGPVVLPGERGSTREKALNSPKVTVLCRQSPLRKNNASRSSEALKVLLFQPKSSRLPAEWESCRLLWHCSWNWASLDPGQLLLLFAKFLDARNLHPAQGNAVFVFI